MFVVSEPLEVSYSNRVNEQTKELNANLSHINSFSGLKKYISEYPNSLENILCLMDISLEKFKRIVSLLRIVKGYSVSSEWDLRKTRNYMLEKSDFMDEVCELLIEGSETQKYQDTIPKFYLDNFKINLNVLSRLTNEDDLKRLIKSKMETSYIVIIDGAGWIGRQSDLQNIYKSCNYFLNLKNLNTLETIVKNF